MTAPITAPPVARPPQLLIVLVIGGLAVASVILFGLGISQALMEHGTIDAVWSRTSFLLASTGAVMTTVLACKYSQRIQDSRRHGEVLAGQAEIVVSQAACHALLEQITAKFEAVNGRFDEVDERFENQKWDIFGELAFEAAGGGKLLPFARNGHKE